ncbi:MAG: ribbon-helix-helix protein, CopG family [Planctomycetes bacterium]|nr:ribbon-helix-helix protein, CopG family [Planctomycetota bacterium]
MAEQMESVTVRLPRAVVKKIAADAETSGIDRSVAMRRLIIEALDREAVAERLSAEMEQLDQRLSAAVEELRQDIARLRERVATATLGILVEVTKGLPEQNRTSAKDLEAWVKKTILK